LTQSFFMSRIIKVRHYALKLIEGDNEELLGQCLWALANFSIEKKTFARLIIDSQLLTKITGFLMDKGYSEFVRTESLTLACNLLSFQVPLPLTLVQKPLLVLGRYLSVMDVSGKNSTENVE